MHHFTIMNFLSSNTWDKISTPDELSDKKGSHKLPHKKPENHIHLKNK